jgi:hypothetical protein
MDISIRPAVASDESFLVEMLVAAAFWRPDAPSGSAHEVLHTPEFAHYISGWPQPGDLGVIAQTHQPVGAARFSTPLRGRYLRVSPVVDPSAETAPQQVPLAGPPLTSRNSLKSVFGSSFDGGSSFVS